MKNQVQCLGTIVMLQAQTVVSCKGSRVILDMEDLIAFITEFSINPNGGNTYFKMHSPDEVQITTGSDLKNNLRTVIVSLCAISAFVVEALRTGLMCKIEQATDKEILRQYVKSKVELNRLQIEKLLHSM